MKLNLTAVDSSQEKILAYLQKNASESLANKINNGTPITKDNVQLINKKDLNSFMSYATDEARKLATQNTRYACVDDATVFGWVMHYFEEESIEGTLYNLDGTEYKPVTKTTSKATSKQKSFTAPTTKVEPPNTQLQSSFWDILDTPKNTEQIEKATIQNNTKQVVDCTNTTSTTLENIHIDTDTGEILEDIVVDEQATIATNPLFKEPEETTTKPVLEELETTQQESTQPVQQEQQTEQQTPTFDRETMIYLATLLDNKIDIA